MIKNSYFFSFLLLSVVILSGSIFIHNFYLKSTDYVFDFYQLFVNYGVNYLMAVLIFAIMVRVNAKNTAIVGFVFLFGSMFKFLVYFTVLQPMLKIDGELPKTKFFFFFLPYAICLVTEVYFLIKMLNSQEEVN